MYVGVSIGVCGVCQCVCGCVVCGCGCMVSARVCVCLVGPCIGIKKYPCCRSFVSFVCIIIYFGKLPVYDNDK